MDKSNIAYLDLPYTKFLEKFKELEAVNDTIYYKVDSKIIAKYEHAPMTTHEMRILFTFFVSSQNVIYQSSTSRLLTYNKVYGKTQIQLKASGAVMMDKEADDKIVEVLQNYIEKLKEKDFKDLKLEEGNFFI